MPICICVLYMAQEWRIILQGRHGARFSAQADAIDAALRLAREVRNVGSEVDVLVQERFGELRRYDERMPPADWSEQKPVSRPSARQKVGGISVIHSISSSRSALQYSRNALASTAHLV